MKDCPPWADMLRMLTTVPFIFSRRMILSTSCIRKNGARTLTANIRSKSSGEVSQIVPRSVKPATLIKTSTRPNAVSAAARAEALGHRAPLVCVAAADHQPLGAAFDEQAGDRLAQPLGSAGHDRDATIEPRRAGGCLIAHDSFLVELLI